MSQHVAGHHLEGGKAGGILVHIHAVVGVDANWEAGWKEALCSAEKAMEEEEECGHVKETCLLVG